MKIRAILWMLLWPAMVKAQLVFTTNNGAITITGFSGNPMGITIPNIINGFPVVSIANGAFNGDFALTNIVIPNSITNLGMGVFSDCDDLTNVTVGAGVISLINAGDFSDCYELETINVDSSNPAYTSVAGVLYDKQELTVVDFPLAKPLTSYSIPESVTSIAYGAFQQCFQLTSVAIPLSVTNIGQVAFLGCTSLTNVNISSNVLAIAEGAFLGCDSLTVINVDSNNPDYSSLGGVLYDKAQTTLFQFPGGKPGSYVIPNSVTNLMQNSIAGCTALTNITLGSGVSGILTGNNVFGSDSLTSINVNSDNPFFSSTNGVLFNKNMTTLIQFPQGRAGTYEVPDWVETIASQAFQYNYNLTSVSIGNGVQNIGSFAFYSCFGLGKITIGESVTNIGDFAFYAGSFQMDIYFRGSVPAFGFDVFNPSDRITLYYLPTVPGWSSSVDNIPAEYWKPQLQTGPANLNQQTNQYGFTINWAAGQSYIVERGTNLSNIVWQPILTNTLANDSFYFSDSQWTNYRARYYRLRTP